MRWQQTLISVFISGLAISCADGRREQQLARRENILAEKERQFALKEADYRSLLRLRDSLMTADTLAQPGWPADMPGKWNGKIVCMESTCTDYVVGDQRSAIWEFIGDSAGLFTRVYDRSTLTRVFSGSFDSTAIHLRFQSDSTARKNMQISVELNRTGPGLMKGSQLLLIDHHCTARFSVELVRASNQ